MYPGKGTVVLIRPAQTFYERIKLERLVPIAVSEARFLHSRAEHKTIVALPTPCTIGDLMWHPRYSAAAYPTREEFVLACVPIIRDEIIALSELGVDAVQLDEPLLPRLADPRTYGYEGLADLEEVVELSVETVNQIAAGLEDAFLTVHLCHGHGAQYKVTPGASGLIMDAAKRMTVDRVAMEFNSPAAQGLQSPRDFPDDKLLGLGVIEPKSPTAESAELIVRRAETAMRFVDRERLTLNPDCGFATTARNSGDLDAAYRKLQALHQGADLLRQSYA